MHLILEKIFENENPKSILEVGCATGILFKEFTEGKDLKIAGIEFEEVNREAFEKNYPKGEFILHDIRNPWPLADKSFDFVFTVGVLLFFEDPRPVLREMFRVGKKVVLAEFHNPELTEPFVDYANGIEHYTCTRIYHNYQSLLKEFGIKPTITKVLDKWVIKT